MTDELHLRRHRRARGQPRRARQAVADELRWSSQKENDHANLKLIARLACNAISATFLAGAESERADAADRRSATADFTEGLLRAAPLRHFNVAAVRISAKVASPIAEAHARLAALSTRLDATIQQRLTSEHARLAALWARLEAAKPNPAAA